MKEKLSVSLKHQKLSGTIEKGNEGRKYLNSIKIPRNLNMATNPCEAVAFKNENIIDQNNGKVNLNKYHTGFHLIMTLTQRCYRITVITYIFRSAIARS